MKSTEGLKRGIVFVTGTDTAVGKTVFTTLLLRGLRGLGIQALAMKPFSSGSPDDVKAIQKIQGGELPESLLNPYHFATPIAPWVAANQAGKKISKSDVIQQIRQARRRCEILIVEGAGGLLTPLGDRFTALELIVGLDCETVLVAPNRLGCLNQVSLAFSVMRQSCRQLPLVAFVEQKTPDLSARSNAQALRRWHQQIEILAVPWVSKKEHNFAAKKLTQTFFKKTLAVSNASGRTSAVLLNAVRRKSKKEVDGSR